jgi:hypothetical protein
MNELGDQVEQLMNQNKLRKMDEFGFGFIIGKNKIEICEKSGSYWMKQKIVEKDDGACEM